MARQPGGTVRLDSRVGQGTSVRILLPCTDQEAGSGERSADGSAATSEAGALILVVDDDPAMRTTLGESLGALGHRVVEAEDGASGVAAARTHRPQLVLLDFAMPGMNGAEVARALWAQAPDLPILFVSGYAETDAIEEVGGKTVTLLRKPFRLETLQAAVAEALRQPT
jgi:CheY-like chemotaxis protein